MTLIVIYQDPTLHDGCILTSVKKVYYSREFNNMSFSKKQEQELHLTAFD